MPSRISAACTKVIRHFGIVGEANIQYALDPNSNRALAAMLRGMAHARRLNHCSARLSHCRGERAAFQKQCTCLQGTQPASFEQTHAAQPMERQPGIHLPTLLPSLPSAPCIKVPPRRLQSRIEPGGRKKPSEAFALRPCCPLRSRSRELEESSYTLNNCVL